MSTRKLLLLSAAIPLLSVSLAATGHAAGDGKPSGHPILLAQAGNADSNAEEIKKRKEEPKKHHGDKQGAPRHQQGAGGGAARSGAERPEHAPAARAGKSAEPRQQEEKPAMRNGDAENRNPRAKEAPPAKAGHAAPNNAETKPARRTQDEKPRTNGKQGQADDQQSDRQHTAKPTDNDNRQHGKPQDRNDRQGQHNRANAPGAADNDNGNSKRPERQHAKPGEKPQSQPADNQAGNKQPDRAKPAENENRNPAAQKPDNQQATGNKRPNGGTDTRSGQANNPLPDQPAKNAARNEPANAKPQRLDVRNGAPVFDSEKNGGRDARRDRRQNDTDRAGNRQPNNDRQQADQARPRKPVKVRSAESEQGKPMKEAPSYRMPQDVKIEKRTDNRVILNIDNRTFVQNDDHRRLSHDARRVRYEQLPDNETRQVVVRPDGSRVVTIRNSYGDIVHRSRIGEDGREVVLIYAPDDDRRDRSFYRRPYVDLPPLQLTEPADDYILDGRRADERSYVRFLEKPPIEPVRQVYTLDQVRYSARLRDIMPRIDLDTITFDTGSAAIGADGDQALGELGHAINSVLQRDPSQVFLIEGHTDAVGSQESNLVLSDERAESVAAALSQDFNVPPENIVTQGYGEEYLKVDTQGAERANRRVTVRRITPLVRPVVQNN